MLYLKGIKHQELTSVLEFLYLGSTRIPQMEVDKFLEVATELEVLGLEQTEKVIPTKVIQTKMIKNLNEATTFTCKDCGFKGMTSEAINKHVINEHALSQELTQNVQPEEKVHKLTTSDTDLPFGCGMCIFSTDVMILLKRHGLDVHDIDDDYMNFKTKCLQCDKIYSCPMSLQGHFRAIHSDTKYICDSCEYMTNRKDTLREHKTKHHSKDFKFNCNECNFGAVRKRYLLNHQTTHHK